ncbi:hypothetical protein GOP47_0012155, partial [Adiantum capillus-veneris]
NLFFFTPFLWGFLSSSSAVFFYNWVSFTLPSSTHPAELPTKTLLLSAKLQHRWDMASLPILLWQGHEDHPFRLPE